MRASGREALPSEAGIATRHKLGYPTGAVLFIGWVANPSAK